jgi:LuxR family maltose regulon positive regulatory protein
VLGISRYWQGADADALATLVEAERLAHESGNVLGRTYALGYRGAITAGIDVDEAAPLADEAMRLAEDPAVGEHFVAMMAHLARGRVRLGRGEAELAEADFSRAVELSRRRAAAVEVAFALVELGRARMLSGAPERARAGLEAAARALEHCRDPGKIADEVARDQRRARPRSARHEADELTARELDVLRLFASELSQREIGAALYVSLNTVKSHARGIFRKLDAANRDEAVAKAHERGLL